MPSSKPIMIGLAPAIFCNPDHSPTKQKSRSPVLTSAPPRNPLNAGMAFLWASMKRCSHPGFTRKRTTSYAPMSSSQQACAGAARGPCRKNACCACFAHLHLLLPVRGSDHASGFCELLSAHDLDAHKALVTLDPSVVSGGYRVRHPRFECLFRSVVQHDRKASGHRIADVRDLAAIRSDDRLYAFRPHPSRIEIQSTHRESGKPHNLDTRLVRGSHFIRVVMRFRRELRHIHSRVCHDKPPRAVQPPAAANRRVVSRYG